jgi:tryptophan-rich sensory protein
MQKELNTINEVVKNVSPTQSWYTELIKPTWAPDPSLFGKVWSILYVMILVAFIITILKTFGKNGGSFAAAITGSSPWPKYIFYIFTFNLFVNIIFSPLQFGLRSLPLAMADILLILGSCFALLYYIFPYSKVVGFLLVPYTIWVCIATVLQGSITWLNR